MRYEDVNGIRANIRRFIKQNAKTKNVKEFIAYIKFLKEIKREIAGHLKKRGIK